MRTHCGRYDVDVIQEIVAQGAYAEFCFFLLTHAAQVGLTHVDQEKHHVPGYPCRGGRAIVSDDAGVFLLPPPVEAMREFMVLPEAADFSKDEIRMMNTTNPAALFRVGGAS